MPQKRQGAKIGQARGKLRLVDQKLAAALQQHLGEALRLFADVERNRDRTEARAGEQRDHERRAVAEQQRHPIARADAVPSEVGGKACSMRAASCA